MKPRLRRLLALGARRALAGLGVAFGLSFLALCVATLLEPLPAAFAERGALQSLEVRDRNGRLIREVRSEDGRLAQRVRLEQLSPWVVPALLAAEDARFYRHPGVDPLAMLRAAGQLVYERRIVSGASTLTQQLARSVVPRPRTVLGKLHEMVVALRIERAFDKRRILEEYLNRVEFGPNVRGIEAASRLFFDKPAADLDLAEAATLVALPRGPTLYDPRRGTERVKRRRDRILERLRAAGGVDAQQAALARAGAVRVALPFAEGGTEHLIAALASGRLLPPSGGQRPQRVELTIDLDLQREVETLAKQAAERIEGYDASAVSVVVLDNSSGDVLAYVGSPDFHSQRALGQNDGVHALRQPGSTLKPFVYAVAMQRLGMTGATLLPDIELSLETPLGPYTPRNYDGRFHGPVRLREALASSLNVPAVYVADRVGPDRVLELLRAAGFDSLDRPALHYGAALALGDGEVRLIELAQAYAMLARGGELVTRRLVRRAWRAGDEPVVVPAAPPRRVLDPAIAAVLTDILADPAARVGAFGARSVLELPFPAAVKTGTSKGFRDNWTVGYTREVTVAVWAGNFDGHSMAGSTGVTGAAPLFHEVMLAAMRGRTPAELHVHPDLVEVEVCALSGRRATELCPHRVKELFEARRVPGESCDMHEAVRIDPENGLRAGPACGSATARVFERYPAEFTSFAHGAARKLAPAEYSPRCPGPRAPTPSSAPRVVFPEADARYVFDPGGPARQELVFAARASSTSLRFVLDGRALGSVRAPFQLPWALAPGRHTLHVEAPGGERSASVEFEVRRE